VRFSCGLGLVVYCLGVTACQLEGRGVAAGNGRGRVHAGYAGYGGCPDGGDLGASERAAAQSKKIKAAIRAT